MSDQARALVLVDVQNEYFTGKLPIEYPDRDVTVNNIAWIMDKARDQGIPIASVEHIAPAASPVFAAGDRSRALHANVAGRPRDKSIVKTMPSAFAGTDLRSWLETVDARIVTLVGYMTQHCVSTTAREAMHYGFAVEVIRDATGAIGLSNGGGSATAEEVHRVTLASLGTMFAGIGSTKDWAEAVENGTLLRPGGFKNAST